VSVRVSDWFVVMTTAKATELGSLPSTVTADSSCASSRGG